MEPIALDMHVHQIPIDPDQLAKLPGICWHADTSQMDIDGHKVAFASLFKPAALLEWLNTNAIAQAWVSVPPPAYRPGLDAAGARQWVDYLSDGLRALCAPHKDKLSHMVHLPVGSRRSASRSPRRRSGAGTNVSRFRRARPRRSCRAPPIRHCGRLSRGRARSCSSIQPS